MKDHSFRPCTAGVFRRPIRSVIPAIGIAGAIAAVPAANAEALYHLAALPSDSFAGPVIAGSAGNFYGIQAYSSNFDSGVDRIYKVAPDGTVTVLHEFIAAEGIQPTGIVQAADGTLYGTAHAGGANGTGTVFRLGLDGQFTVLHSFAAAAGQLNADGGYPTGLSQGSDGNLYGSCLSFGTGGSGTVFEITPSGTFTLLHSFSSLNADQTNVDGANPGASPPVVGRDGNLYGAAREGGPNALGTLFKIASDGTFSVIHPINTADGISAPRGLMQAANGDLYGSANSGKSIVDAIYRTDTAGNGLTVLHVFDSLTGSTASNVDGLGVEGALIQTPDGLLYGTAGTINAGGAGGQNSHGTLFRISPQGEFAVVHQFMSFDSYDYEPSGPPVLGADGNFYGTTLGIKLSDNSTQNTFYKIVPQTAFDVRLAANPSTVLVGDTYTVRWSTTSDAQQCIMSKSGSNFHSQFAVPSRGAWAFKTDYAFQYGKHVFGFACLAADGGESSQGASVTVTRPGSGAKDQPASDSLETIR